MRDYNEIYKDLGIVISPLSDNYDPEIYGRELMRGVSCHDEISYSSATSYNSQALTSKDEDRKMTFA